jgi:hypothetical protein
MPQEPNGDIADLAINLVSHEMSEAITDPVRPIDPLSGQVDETAWGFPEEVSDKCELTGNPTIPTFEEDPNAFLPVLGGDAASGTQYTELINGHEYFTQSNWSNATSSCLMRTGASAGGGGTGGAGGTGGTGGTTPGGTTPGGATSAGIATPTIAHPRVAGKAVNVRLTCRGTKGQTCKLMLVLTTAEIIRGGHKHKPRKKLVALGNATVTLTAGQSKTTKLTLNGTGRRLLSSHHRLKVTLTITKRVGASTRLVSTRTLTFTVAKPNHRH